MELITEKELGRLKKFNFHHNFTIPKYAGEIVVVRFEKSKLFLNEEKDHENWKPPADLKCNIWMMDAVGEFIDCVQDYGDSALAGLVSLSSDMESYFPKAKIDLNAIQMSGTGMVLITLSTEKDSIYEVMKNLTVYLDVINPSKYRRRDNILLNNGQTENYIEEEVWNVLSFSPTGEVSVYNVDEDWNNVAVIMFFMYGDRWQVKPLSHMYFANELSEKIKDTKNLCYALNNIILKNKELPNGCKSIRSLLLADKIDENNKFYTGSNDDNNNESGDRILKLDELNRSEIEALSGPMLLRNQSVTTDYKNLVKRLNERKNFLKEYLEKNHDRLTKGKVLIDEDGKVNYITEDICNNFLKKNDTDNLESDSEEDGWNIDRDNYTIESANQEIQILKQTVNELQMQLVDIMDMFISTTPPSFTVQGTANEITYKELIDEIQYLENTLAAYKQDFVLRRNRILRDNIDQNIVDNKNEMKSDVASLNSFNHLNKEQISILQPVISNMGYSEFIEKMDKLRGIVEIFGQKSRKTVIENIHLKSDAREHAFRKIKNLECRYDQLNTNFNNFLFEVSTSNIPKHIHIVN